MATGRGVRVRSRVDLRPPVVARPRRSAVARDDPDADGSRDRHEPDRSRALRREPELPSSGSVREGARDPGRHRGRPRAGRRRVGRNRLRRRRARAAGAHAAASGTTDSSSSSTPWMCCCDSKQPGSGGISFSGDWYIAQQRAHGGHAVAPTPDAAADRRQRAEGHPATRHDRATDGSPPAGAKRIASSGGQESPTLSRRFDDEYRGIRSLRTTSPGSFRSTPSPTTRSPARPRTRMPWAAPQSLGFTDVVAHWPREEGIYAGKESVLDEIAGMLANP